MEAGKAALAARRSSAFSYDGAIRFLGSRGLDEVQVREGSMPETSLASSSPSTRTSSTAASRTR